MRRALAALVGLFSSVGLGCVLLLLLFVLTYLGTLHQVEHGLYLARRTYFDSWWLSQPIAGGMSIPLPGGLLVMALLFVNLLVGGIVRLRFTARRAGILVTHVGIAFLLVAGFVKFALAEEGALQLFEGARGSTYQSYYDWELVVTGPGPGDARREYVVPQERFEHVRGGGRHATFVHDELPFALDVTHFLPSARPLPKGPMFTVDVPVVDGFFLQAQPRHTEAERDVAGCYVAVRDPSGATQPGIVWAGALAPLVVERGGAAWSIDLRKQRMEIPFTVVLDRTERELHPGTGKPRAFTSDVTMIDGAVTQQARIEMNAPLRHAGYVLYQSGWGPEDPRPGDRLFSVFAVVRNPADRWPLYACIVIAAGLLIHFSQSLRRYIGRELGAA